MAKKINKKTEVSDAEVKRASDERRAKRKKQHIRIHADRIENLDERDEKERREAVEVKETGYSTQCRLVNKEGGLNWLRRLVNRMLGWAVPRGESVWKLKFVRRVEFKRKFVEMRVETRCVHIFHDPKRDKMYVQFPPLKMMNRTSIAHLKKKKYSWAHRYGYYAELDMTPEPAYVMMMTGVHPDAKVQDYRLVEEDGKCRYFGVTKVYRMEPKR